MAKRRTGRGSAGTKTPRGWDYLHTWRWAQDAWLGGEPATLLDLANALAYARLTAVLAPATEQGRLIRDAAEDLEDDATKMLESSRPASRAPKMTRAKKEAGHSQVNWDILRRAMRGT